MSNSESTPPAWRIIEAARNASERNIRFSVSTGLGNFYASHEGPYVWCELRKESGELRNQELADIIRAKCKEVMRETEAKGTKEEPR